MNITSVMVSHNMVPLAYCYAAVVVQSGMHYNISNKLVAIPLYNEQSLIT